MTTRPLPVPTAWSAAFWEGAAQGMLLYQYCTVAEHPVMYPKRLSPFTLEETLEWRESAGTGEIYTYTVQRLGAPTGFSDELPYVIAVVRLDEGFQMLTNVVGADVESIRCGARVRVAFQDIGGMKAPVFELESAS